MKKLLSILLTALMVISCFSITASAETADTTQAFCDALNNYIADRSDCYTPDVTPENINEKSWLTVFSADKDSAVFGIQGVMDALAQDEIDGYVFHASNLFATDENPCGYFYYTNGNIYSIAKAVGKSLVTPRELAQVIPGSEYKSSYTAKKAMLSEKMNYSEFTLIKLGEIGEYDLYYDLSDMAEPWEPTVCIGNYEFIAANGKFYNNPGLYLLSATTAYTLEEAYNEGIVTDMDAVYGMIVARKDINYAFMVKNIKYKDTLKEYLLSTGVMAESEVEQSYRFKDFGKVGKYNLCHGSGMLHHEVYYETVIGTYTIQTKKEWVVNPLGLYLVAGETVYPFDATAYENGIITDIELDQIIALIQANMEDDAFSGWTITNLKKNRFSCTESFCDSVNQYIISLGLGEAYFGVDTSAEGYVEGDISTYTYVNVFTPENILSSDNIVIYKEDENSVYFQIVGLEKIPSSEKIGDYTFTADTFFHQDNPCGYCYDNKYDPLVSIATKTDGVTIAILAELFPSINNKLENIQNAELLLNARYGGYYNLVDLGNINGEYNLYYNDTSFVQFLTRDVTLDEYEFRIFANQTPYDMGLYVVSSDTAYTFEEAYEAGIVTDMDAVYCMITARTDLDYNFTVEIINTEILPAIKIQTKSVKSGEKTKVFTVENAETVTFASANTKVATVDEKGVVTGLKKGTAKITVTADGVKTTFKIKVTTNPQLTLKGKAVKAVQVKKNKTVKLKLTGKVKTIKNVYTNTAKAKITSGKNATVIKVKALKKGTTTLKVKVNGVKTLKLKVKVK